MAIIHPTAVVDPNAELADSVEVGPYAIIEAHVHIGERTKIGAHAFVTGHTSIGEDNVIAPFTSIGSEPQDKKYAGEPTELIIGDRNTIREYTSIHVGTIQDGGKTIIGHDNWIMSYIHIAHDCCIGDHTILANNSQLAGHVIVEDYAILGGFTLAHQFVRIGAHSMTSINTVLLQEVPTYTMVGGNPSKAVGINSEGLKRRGFSPEAIDALKEAFKIVYRQGHTLTEAKSLLKNLCAEHPLEAPHIRALSEFLEGVRRGIVR